MEKKGRSVVMVFDSVYLHGQNSVTPLGMDLAANWEALLAGRSGIALRDMGASGQWHLAMMDAAAAEDLAAPPGESSLLEKMLFTAAKPLVEQHPPTARTALILSTTKGNVSLLQAGQVAEAALPVLAEKMAKALGFRTEPIVVSQACVSGLLALSVAKRLIQMGQYDDAVVLAGDSISAFITSGFQAFQALSPFPCKPFDAHRAGLSLGEAAACVYVSKEIGSFKILGEAAINDANHISGPSRTGEGLVRSVLSAVKEANMDVREIDFISAHGTATLYNDEMEAIAFNRLGLQSIPMHSLKGYYGHTLGASGLLEMVMALQSLKEDLLIPTLGFDTLGVSQPLEMIRDVRKQPLRRFLKTASGFGGSNAVMIIEKLC